MKRYLLIALGGGCGSMLRFYIGTLAAERFGPRFPMGTLLINVSACFLIGASLEFLNHHVDLDPAWRFLIPTGFIGGYSTFSTFEWELWRDVSTGTPWLGLFYLAASIAGGLLAVALGSAAVRRLG